MNINMSGKGRVTIDGRDFVGGNVTVNNGQVTVDGVRQGGSLSGSINIEVHGDVNTIENQTGNITAKNVGEASTGSGDINCANVSGSVRTGSGDVSCGQVGGNVRTGSGDITHR